MTERESAVGEPRLLNNTETEPAPPVLRISGVSKAYGSTNALVDVSFELHAGEVLCLMGHNGAGKSTLIKIISGAEEPTAGTIYLDRKEVKFTSVQSAQDVGIATVFQELRIIDNISVAENVFLPDLPVQWGFVKKKTMYDEAKRVFEELGIPVDPAAEAGALSQAERQLVEIAAAQRRRAKVLVFDEPTSSLGAEQIEELLRVLRREASRGTAILLVTHKIAEALEVADRILVLRDGRLVADGPRAEFSTERLVSELTGAIELSGSDNIGGGEEVVGVGQREQPAAGKTLLTVNGLRAGGVKEASLTVSVGEIVGLYGLLGSGRSALLRALYGVNRVTGGEITVDGRPYRPVGPTLALEAGICFLTEERKRDGIVADLSVRSNQALASLSRFRTLLGFLDKRKLAATTDSDLKRLAIRGRGSDLMSALSGGNQQKVLFSRLHFANARLWLLDEPTRGVDVGAKREIYDVIREEASRGRGILVASSEVEEICELCNRCYVVVDGYVGAIELRGDEITQNALRVAAAREGRPSETFIGASPGKVG